MKALVVCYSRSGITKNIALKISQNLNCDVEIISDNKKRKGIFGFLISGYEAMTKKLVKINKIKNDPENYNLVVIGSPTWAGSLSSPVRTYLTYYGKKIKNVAFFTTCMDNGGKIFVQMQELTKLPLEKVEINSKEYKSGEYKTKIEEFINALKNKI